MSIDMSQFYQVFFEETAEHLESMESLLLGLDLDAPDVNQLNAIFRAAHSIKGGGGTFGFTDMTEVTHVLETLLDGIRNNELSITADTVDACLQAKDVLRVLLNAHQNGENPDPGDSAAICTRLQELIQAGSKASGVGTQPEVTFVLHDFQISFPNTHGIFPSAGQLDSLLEEIANVGKIENLKIAKDCVTFNLATYLSEAALAETFYFFLNPEQLTLIPMAVGKHAIESDQGYGFFDEQEFVVPARDTQGDTPPRCGEPVVEDPGYGFFVDSDKSTGSPTPFLVNLLGNEPSAAKTSIRVSVEKVDQLINQVGELVITRSMLAETASRLESSVSERLLDALAQLDRNTRELQESVMSIRMMPINFVFSRFPRLVRDLAGKLGKQVELRLIGEGTELDKGLIEKIGDPLTHLVRNSLDHGIESVPDRIEKGKNPQGTITLRAAHQGGSIVIEVSDDGAGLNRGRILAKARETGLPVSDSMIDADVWQLIFAPGFSTATTITDVSGRGVGMDVVKRNIEGMGGRVEILSRQGLGSTVTIRLPLTLAILDGLSIGVGEQIYIVPMNFIVESWQPEACDIRSVKGQGQVVQVRGEYLPLIALYKVFNIVPRVTDPALGILVLLEADGRRIALLVDDLLGQHQVVVKSLERNYRKVAGVSGATIMGDGRVAMIMDVGALVELAQT